MVARSAVVMPHDISKNGTVRFEDVYHDQGDEEYDDADEGGPLPKLTDDPADLAPFIPADKAAVLAALRLTGATPRGGQLNPPPALINSQQRIDSEPSEILAATDHAQFINRRCFRTTHGSLPLTFTFDYYSTYYYARLML